MKKPKTPRWKVGRTSVRLLMWGSDVMIFFFYLILRHKMSWLEFRQRPSSLNQNWKPGDLAKECGEAAEVKGFVSKLCRNVSNLARLHRADLTGLRRGNTTDAENGIEERAPRRALMKAFSFCISQRWNIPLLLSVSPRKVIRKCNYANDIKSPLKYEFMYLLARKKKQKKMKKLPSHFCQELPGCLMHSYEISTKRSYVVRHDKSNKRAFDRWDRANATVMIAQCDTFLSPSPSLHPSPTDSFLSFFPPSEAPSPFLPAYGF